MMRCSLHSAAELTTLVMEIPVVNNNIGAGKFLNICLNNIIEYCHMQSPRYYQFTSFKCFNIALKFDFVLSIRPNLVEINVS